MKQPIIIKSSEEKLSNSNKKKIINDINYEEIYEKKKKNKIDDLKENVELIKKNLPKKNNFNSKTQNFQINIYETKILEEKKDQEKEIKIKELTNYARKTAYVENKKIQKYKFPIKTNLMKNRSSKRLKNREMSRNFIIIA